MEVDNKMPQHEYYEYFGPDYTLHVAPSNMENKNSRQILEEIRNNLLENLSKLQHAPSVQFQERPPGTDLPEVRTAATFFLFAEYVSSFPFPSCIYQGKYHIFISVFTLLHTYAFMSILGIGHFTLKSVNPF